MNEIVVFSKSRRRAKDLLRLIREVGAPMYLGSGMSDARIKELLEEYLPRKRNA